MHLTILQQSNVQQNDANNTHLQRYSNLSSIIQIDATNVDSTCSYRLIRGVNDSATDRPYLSSSSHLLISTQLKMNLLSLSLDSQATTSHM